MEINLEDPNVTIIELLSALGLTTNPQILAQLEVLTNKMADLNQSVQDLRAAVTDVADRVNSLVTPLRDALAEAQNTLVAERQAATDLAAAEDAEDVEQNQALTDAQAATDAALADAAARADEIETEVARLNEVAPRE